MSHPPNTVRASEPVRQIAETTLGPVEYAVVGTGTPVVVLHGSPGGIDAAALMAGILPRDGISAILLSRPGYLGTELGDRRTIDQQADLLAALLDHLGIERAGVFSWSGGGPAGYRLAVRHPDRVSALVAFAAVSQAYHVAEPGPGHPADVHDRCRALAAAAARRPPAQAVHLRCAVRRGQPDEGAVGSAGRGGLRRPGQARLRAGPGPDDRAGQDPQDGYRNDLAQFADITSLELERITAPTLVVQGTADSDLPPAQSTFAAETIPGAELLTLDTGTHLALFTHPDAAATQARVVDFLLRRAAGRPQSS